MRGILGGLVAAACAGAFAVGCVPPPQPVGPPANVTHGPQIQHVATDAAVLWLRTDRAAQIAVAYGEPGGATSTATGAAATVAGDFTSTVRLTGLEAATEYEYRVLLDGNAGAPRRFTTAPPEGSSDRVDIALFSDVTSGKQAPSLHAAAAMDPDVALILGDWDHDNPHNLSASREMHRQLRGPESRLGEDFAETLIANQVPTYATWDDHDYCGNNTTVRCGSRETAMQAWGEYHAFADDNGFPNGIWQRFVYGPAEVFVLDLRSNRQPGNCTTQSMLGAEQAAWLYDGLATSTAQWKVIVSSVPMNNSIYKSGDSWQGYPCSRAELLNSIEGIDNVVFVSGDIHSGGAIDSGVHSGRPELSVPLTNQSVLPSAPNNWDVYLYPRSHNGYGWLEIDGDSLRMVAYGEDGALRGSYIVAAE